MFKVSCKMFLESAGDGTAAVSPGVCGRKSSVQAERKQQQPADHGAPSPSERSASVQLLKRTRGGGVARQIPDSGGL